MYKSLSYINFQKFIEVPTYGVLGVEDFELRSLHRYALSSHCIVARILSDNAFSQFTINASVSHYQLHSVNQLQHGSKPYTYIYNSRTPVVTFSPPLTPSVLSSPLWRH